MWNSRPSPFREKTILNFHFDYLNTSLLDRWGCYWKTVPPQWGGGRLLGASKKLIPRLELNHLTEGYEWAIDKIWGSMGKNGDLGQKPSFRAQKIPLKPTHRCASLAWSSWLSWRYNWIDWKSEKVNRSSSQLDYHWLSLFAIDYHQLSLNIIDYHW